MGMNVIKVTAPVRIDFAGGWSDTPPICNREGGTVLNAAVLLDGKRPIEVTVAERSDKLVRVISKDLGKRRILKSASEIADHQDPNDWCALVKSALTVTGFKFGSRGLDITLSADLPKGSGMGTSSILGAATIAALLGEIDVDRISRLTLALEQEMCTGGGWQDQLGGLVGGFKLLRSKPGKDQKVEIKRLMPSADFLADFKARALLYFTGQKRMARNILRNVIRFYDQNPHGIAKILVDSLKDDAEACAKALRKGDMDRFARAVNGYWMDKKLLDPGSTNDHVDDIIDLIKEDASALTLTGAGGGGFLFVLAKDVDAAKRIRKTLGKNSAAKASRFYDVEIDLEGMRMERGLV